MHYQTDSGQEVLWLTDHLSGRVAKTTLTGEVIQALAANEYRYTKDDDGGACDKRGYAPTWAAQCPKIGAIWFADGYGATNAANLESLTGNDVSDRLRSDLFETIRLIDRDALGRAAEEIISRATGIILLQGCHTTWLGKLCAS